MTKQEFSKASWIALLGLTIAVAGAVIGMPVAGQLLSNNDDALASGLIGGAVVGAVLGGMIVGVLCRRGQVLPGNFFLPSLAAPGTLFGIPLLLVAVIGRDWAVLWWIALLVVSSGVAATVGASFGRKGAAARR